MLPVWSEVKILKTLLALLDPEAVLDVLRNPFGDRDKNKCLSDPFGLALDTSDGFHLASSIPEIQLEVENVPPS